MGLLARAVPYLTLAAATVMPLAAGLYLLTTTACAAAERALLRRRIAPPARPDSAPRDVRPRSRSA